ncbi:MAG: hypothetical protein OSJ53_00900 [Kineothrix sp.]|jgi:hypothetical protein|nr:hypothetical protein [Lachnospiraceae bacterium]MCX4342435.1 hypothetical protein [Kineothrix sp.]
MKKFIALLTAATLFASMTVSAAPSPSAAAVVSSGAEGFAHAADQQAAAERGMTAAEYYNNAVVSTPGVENAMPVGQGGKIVINGVATNLTATLAKVDKTTAAGANAQAAALGGTLLNVINISFPGANYNTATINFYLKGLLGDSKVVVKQLVNGVWVDVEVVEIRADHVVLNLTGKGAVAFVQIP